MTVQQWLVESFNIAPSLAHSFQKRVPEVLHRLPHEVVYTQGLLCHAGFFYESSRLSGISSLCCLEPVTGKVLARVILANRYLAGGLALVEDTLFLLTWQGTAFLYYLISLKRKGMFRFGGEGWGLCYDGTHLYTSDGSHTLYLRDPTTFECVGEISVTLEGQPLSPLAELECVGEVIYATVANTGLSANWTNARGRLKL